MLENKDCLIKMKLKHRLIGCFHFPNQFISHHLTICSNLIRYFAIIAMWDVPFLLLSV